MSVCIYALFASDDDTQKCARETHTVEEVCVHVLVDGKKRSEKLTHSQDARPANKRYKVKRPVFAWSSRIIFNKLKEINFFWGRIILAVRRAAYKRKYRRREIGGG